MVRIQPGVPRFAERRKPDGVPRASGRRSPRYGRTAMAPEPSNRDTERERGRRRAARELIGAYHEEQLRLLLDRVRTGFVALDGGEIWEHAAHVVRRMRAEGEELDWWAAGAPRKPG